MTDGPTPGQRAFDAYQRVITRNLIGADGLLLAFESLPERDQRAWEAAAEVVMSLRPAGRWVYEVDLAAPLVQTTVVL